MAGSSDVGGTRGKRRGGRPLEALSASQLGELAAKALENSLALLDEAEGLASFGRYPRAMALCILAEEEFGKHMMATGALGRAADDEEFWKEFWRRFRLHRPKYENALSLIVAHLENDKSRQAFRAEFEKHISADLERKMSGLYVKVRAGEVISPAEAIDVEVVSRSLHVAGTVIRSWAELHAGVDFVSAFPAAEADAKTMQAALASGDPDRIKEAWDQTTTP